MELDRVESLIKEDPSYAQIVLDSLYKAEESLFAEPDFQARYILLNEYAKYRNGIDEKDDSVISIAEEYYMLHGTNHERMLVLFLHGRALFSSQEYDSAMLKYAYAAEYAKACSDHFMLGQIYTNQYLLCADAFGANSIELALAAAEEYAMSNDSIYMLDGETNLGIAYYRNRQYEQSEVRLQSALQTATQQRDTFAIKKCIRFLAYMNNEKGEAIKADSLFHELFQTHRDAYFLKDYAVLSEVYAQLNKYDSALYYLSQANVNHYSWVENRIQYLKSATRVYEEISNYEEALHYCKEYQCLSDSVLWGHLNNSVMREQRDFIQDKLTETEQTNYHLLFSISCLILLSVIVSFLFVILLRKRKIEIQLLQKTIETMKLEKDLHAQEYENALMALKANAFIQQIHDIARSNRGLTADELSRLNALFCELLPRFEQSLRELISMSDMEWQICMLLKISCSPGDIAVLLNRSAGAISSARIRMYSKVFHKKGRTTDWDEFINSL